MRFALVTSAASIVMVLLYALAVAANARSVLEDSFDRGAMDTVRGLAAGGAEGWFGKTEKGKQKAAPGAGARLELFVKAAPQRIYNAYITGVNGRVAAQLYESEFQAGTEYAVGHLRIAEGRYRSGSFKCQARRYSAPILNHRSLAAGRANLIVSAEGMEEDFASLRQFTLLMGILVVIVLVATAFVLAGQMTRPLRVLVQAVSRVNRGNLSYRSTIKSRDELGLLSRALEDMVDNIAAGEEAHERVLEHENELQMATQLKNALLPKQLPTIDGFEVAALHAEGRRGVADFYDSVALDGGRIALIVASSSGTGALGSQVAMLARALLHAYIDSGVDPKEALFRSNRQLSRAMRKGLHLTAQLVVLDPGKSRATVYIAGHPAPFYSCRAGEIQVVHGEGLALGLDKGPVFERRLEEVTVEMPPGTRIVMTTVGSYEFETETGRSFGVERFEKLVRQHAPKNTEAFLSLVLGQMTGFENAEGERECDAILVTAKRML
ncbi:MAG: hypothetical protein CSA62_08315 [Planctomycetota bacterium]|nr:MAG: hypothetical protein CSA62_08315 [Planctomycetota bacterium]